MLGISQGVKVSRKEGEIGEMHRKGKAKGGINEQAGDCREEK